MDVKLKKTLLFGLLGIPIVFFIAAMPGGLDFGDAGLIVTSAIFGFWTGMGEH